MSLSIPKPGFVSFFDLLPKQAFDSAIDLLYCMCRERYDQSEVKKVAFNYDLTVINNSIGHRKLPIYSVVWTRDQCNESFAFDSRAYVLPALIRFIPLSPSASTPLSLRLLMGIRVPSIDRHRTIDACVYQPLVHQQKILRNTCV